MSTLPNQAVISSSWKQEVNQRVAAHKNRKPTPAAELDAANQAHHSANQRAVAAAARVAARFAKAPSYSEIVAEEARAAVRAAEAVSRAALEAQAAAESVLAELEAAQQSELEAESRWDHEREDSIAEETSNGRSEPAHAEAVSARQEFDRAGSNGQSFEIRWEPDLKLRQASPSKIQARSNTEFVDDDRDDWQERARPAQEWLGGNAIEVVEPAQPIHANLIEFPREIVATRKVRPRRVEGPYAAIAEQGAQLSIFEVDSGAISIDPAAPDPVDLASPPTWTGPEWSGMELDAQPQTEFARDFREELYHETRAHAIGYDVADQAPLTLRLMAVVVDFALMLAALLVAAIVAGGNAKDLPSLRATEVGSIAGLLVVSALYLALFYALGKGTPGMKYAGIFLCTFEGREPARAQRFSRLAALLLSVLPVGLGVMWALFDDDHLSWHDRLSQTYLRRN